MYKKRLSFIIVLLFIVISIIPLTQSFSIEKQVNYESLPIKNSTKQNSEISLITLNVAGVTGGDNWYGSDNNFTITYESDEIAEIYYGVDGNWSLYTGMFNVFDGGNHILEWYAIDYEGNQSEVDGPFFFKVDKTSPDLSLSYEIIGSNWKLGFFEIMLTAIASDSMSGMDYVDFYINDVWQGTVTGSLPQYNWCFWINPEIVTNVTAKAFDIAGNSATDTIYDIVGPWTFKNFFNEILSSRITKRENNNVYEKSQCSISNNEVFDPASVIVVFNRKIGENDWINSNASLSIFYESDRIDEVYYQINSGSWLLYTDSLVISEDGNYVFSWYVIDLEGNSSIPDSISFKVDLTSPELNLTRKRLGLNKVRFIADVNDNTSGVDRVRFQGEYGSDFIDYDYPFEWVWTGSSFLEKVTVTVYDKAGNKISRSMKTRVGLTHNPRIITSSLNDLFFQILQKLVNIKLYSFLY